MFNFDKEKYLEGEKRAATELVNNTVKLVDEICAKGFSNIFFVGIGGTITYAWQVETIVKSHSTLKLFVENAADLVTLGNKNFTKDSIMVIESASGDTKEVVAAVEYAHKVGAKVLGFIEKPGSPLAELTDYLVLNQGGTFYYWYAVALRFMFNAGDFPQYDKLISEIQAYLPDALCAVKEKGDAAAEAFAEKYMDEPIHYLIGAGNLWGGAYCYAMCIMEEMQWMRTKSVSGADFFHGTLEVVERDTSVILFKGEDAARPQMERVEKFVHTISNKVTVFDSADYELKGISPEFRGLLSPFVINAVCKRISKHLEFKRKHPLAIRRYYRHLDY